MKLNINREKLLNFLYFCQGIVEKRQTLPILANVLLEAVVLDASSGKEGYLKISATDLELAIKGEIEADVKRGGFITVSAKKLYEIVKEIQATELSIAVESDGKVEIRGGGAIFKIVYLSHLDFPPIPFLEFDSFIKLDSDKLLKMIEKVVFAMSSDETKYTLNGIYLDKVDENRFNLVATDGHRLALISDSIIDGVLEKPVLLPKKGVLELKKILEIYKGDAYLSVKENSVLYKNEKVVLIIRMVEGEFPVYKEVIPRDFKRKVVINKASFLSALKRVSILTTERMRSVILRITKDSVEVFSSSPELGEASETLEASSSNGDLQIAFNYIYLMDAIKVLDGENVTFNMNDELNPVMLCEEESTYFCIVMPMRV